MGCTVTLLGKREKTKDISISDILNIENDIKKQFRNRTENILEEIYIISNHPFVWVTKATEKMLGNSYTLRKLVYHIYKNCSLARKDYIVEDTIVAINSGIICIEPDAQLTCCQECQKHISLLFKKERSSR